MGAARDVSRAGMAGREELHSTLYPKSIYTVTYSGFSIHDGTLLHSKSQYTTVKHSRQISEHTYTSNPPGLGTPTPIEFFQQDLLWQSSITRSHSCSQKASKHTSGQSIVGLSVHLHTTTTPRRIVHHLPAPAPTIECLHRHGINSRASLAISRYELSLPAKRSPQTNTPERMHSSDFKTTLVMSVEFRIP
jgi:hypothetical protein